VIGLDRGTYISGRYWPANVAFKEPSRLTNKEATEILEWWRDRQVSDPTNTFKVKRWLESDGSLQAVVAIANHKSAAKRTGKKPRKGKYHSIKFTTTEGH